MPSGALSSVEVADLDGRTRHLPADVLLPFFGLSMDLGPIAGWGLDLERHHLRIDPATCQTSIAGVFAIGDVVAYPGKLKLILQGLFGSGDGSTRDPPDRAAGRGAAFRVFNQQRRALTDSKVLCFFLSRKKFFSEEKNQKTFAT